MDALLVDVGAVAGFCGMLWYAWDHNAKVPPYLLGFALVAVIAGSLL